MIESDTWCPDVVVQIASATRALQEVAVGLVNDHLHHCVMAAAKGSDDNGQTAQMLAALWDRPQATYASKVELDQAKAKVTREVDAGLETIEVDLPAVISTDLRLNEPRYVKLPDIMKAKKKPLDIIKLADLGVEAAGSGMKTLKFEAPAVRSRGIVVKTVPELVAALKQRGVL